MRYSFVQGWPLALLVACAPAAANLVVNGSFEDPPGQRYVPVLQTFDGWKVTGEGGIKLGDFWQAAQGIQEVDLCGISGGGIRQLVPTTVAQRYLLSFALAGNPDGGPAMKPMVYRIGEADPQTLSFDTTGHSGTDMGWTYYRIPFVATSDSTALLFSSAINSDAGPALDDVRVNPVPPGDANDDLHVGFDDLITLAQHYGTSGAGWNDGDFDGDGMVGFTDLILLAQNYGRDTTDPPAQAEAVPVPEPHELFVFLAGAVGLGARRRVG